MLQKVIVSQISPQQYTSATNDRTSRWLSVKYLRLAKHNTYRLHLIVMGHFHTVLPKTSDRCRCHTLNYRLARPQTLFFLIIAKSFTRNIFFMIFVNTHHIQILLLKKYWPFIFFYFFTFNIKYWKLLSLLPKITNLKLFAKFTSNFSIW